MSSINLTKVDGSQIPAVPNGEVEFFTDLEENPSIKTSTGIKTLGAIFGSQFTNKRKSVTETTTSFPFVNYDTLNLTGLPQGNYMIQMRWVWGYSSASNDIEVRWQLDGNDIIPIHKQEPKDGGSDQRHHTASFEVLSLDGDHTITIDFASSNGSAQARMYQSQIIVYRID